MELAKVTAKGQITIPAEIRKRLNLNTGSKVLFVQEAGRIYILNASADEIKDANPDSVRELKKALKIKI